MENLSAKIALFVRLSLASPRKGVHHRGHKEHKERQKRAQSFERKTQRRFQ